MSLEKEHRSWSLIPTHHVEDGGVLAGGEHHLWLEAGLQEEAVCRHRAASAEGESGVGGLRTDVSVGGTRTQCTPSGRNLLLALAASSRSSPPTRFLPLGRQANSLICLDSWEKKKKVIIIILEFTFSSLLFFCISR